MSDQVGQYVLPESDARRIFDRDIVPTRFAHLHGHTSDGVQPVVVVVVGQPGSGKTGTADRVFAGMESVGRSPAHIVGDVYKPFHPAYRRLLVEDPAMASPAVSADARRWNAMAVDYAVQHRLDVVLEAAARDPTTFEATLRRFHDGGYRVEVAFLAVGEGLSRLGILSRYIGDEYTAEAGRLTSRAAHDASYAGIVDAASLVDRSGLADQVVVVRRNDQVAYANTRLQDRWREDPAAAAAIHQERDRPLQTVEIDAYERAIGRLHAMNDPMVSAELKVIEALVQPLIDREPAAGVSSRPTLEPLAFPTHLSLGQVGPAPGPDDRSGLAGVAVALVRLKERLERAAGREPEPDPAASAAELTAARRDRERRQEGPSARGGRQGPQL